MSPSIVQILWGTYPIIFLKVLILSLFKTVSSTNTSPLCSSKPKMQSTNVVFPAPDKPTIPINSPLFILKFIFSNTLTDLLYE